MFDCLFVCLTVYLHSTAQCAHCPPQVNFNRLSINFIFTFIII